MTMISDVISAIKLPPKIMAGLTLPSAMLVFAPTTWIDQFGLAAFINVARPYVALVFIVSASILLVEFCIWAYAEINRQLSTRRAIKKLADRVRDLDPAELVLLREFFIQGQSTVKLPMDQPVVAGLIQKGIVRQVGQLGERTIGGMTFSFRLNEEARKLITIDALGIPRNPSEEDKRRIVSERPHYMRAIQEHESIYHMLL